MKRRSLLVPLVLALMVSAPSALGATRAAGVAATVAAPSAGPESPSPSSLSPSPTEEASPSAWPSPSAEASPPACASSPSPGATPPPLISMPQDVRLALFQAVWQGIDGSYVDSAHNGIDWATVRSTYLPQVGVLEAADEMYQLIATMVDGLDDPYTAYLNPTEVKASSQAVGYGGIGALMETPTTASGDGLRVLYVFPGGPADHAGLLSRDRIVAVDGDPCVSIDRIRGEVGTSVTLLVQSPGGKPRDVVVERGQISGSIAPSAKRLTRGTIGYLRLATLAGQGTAAEDALRRFTAQKSIRGLMIDLRSTTLGLNGSMSDLLGQFVQGDVGSFYSRTDTAPINVDTLGLSKALAKVPVAVLVDAHTSGEAEAFAAILQDQKRAVIVGQQTRGRSDLAQPVDYPDGSRLILVTAGLELPDGTRLQGHGITPDVAVDADWLAVPENDDPYIKAAIKALQ